MSFAAFWLGVRLLLLLAAANSAPIIAKRLFGARWSWPIDGGAVYRDGRPWLGKSKTWRGLVVAVLATTVLAPVLGFHVADGALLGVLAMTGDALSSFVKRRIGVPPSGQAFGIDQVPEALLPLLLMQDALGLDIWTITAVTIAFLLLEMPAAWLSWRAGLRDEPY